LSGDCRYVVLPIIAALLPFTRLSISAQILQYGIWVYLLVFVVILLASTVFGGLVPDNTFLFLIGVVALENGLSMELLFVTAFVGGFVGYEINYWSGRLFGFAIIHGPYSEILTEGNIRKAYDMVDRFGPAALIISRFMPVLHLPSFIAGVEAMEYRRYVGFNLISSAVWSGIVLMLGYYVGSISIFSGYLDYLTYLIIVILAAAIILALVMFARYYVKRNRSRSPE
jgi:membrane-associated protein